MDKPLHDILFSDAFRRFLDETKTPCYIYCEEILRRRAEGLKAAFAWNDGFSFYTPVAENPNPAVLRILKDSGCAVMCQSEEDLILAKQCGFTGSQILYCAYSFDPSAQELARDMEAVFVFDGSHAVPDFPVKQALLSVKSRISCCRLTLGNGKMKFGMYEDELLQLAEKLNDSGTRIGLFYMGYEYELAPGYPAELLGELLRVTELLLEKGIQPESLCVSGPPGISSRSTYQTPDIFDVSRQLKDQLNRWQQTHGDRRFRLMLCPGRYLLTEHGVLLTRVRGIKHQIDSLAIVDLAGTQMLHLIQKGVHHKVTALSQVPPSKLYGLCGCLMDNRDYIYGRVFLPELSVGDVLIVHFSGAMGSGFSSRYGGFAAPEPYMFYEDGHVERADML